ncbi:hypothetical protein [Phenylobacterium sp.]|uniref:hypothetical protein n=1 Tax=Phenylobacterium sp. TaxID=1871053 RepID=UPI003562F543
MLDALTITEAEAAGLSELAALDLAMARDFAARAQAAENPQVASDLARSYQRVARSYRQSLALKLRLQREIARGEREARENPAPIGPMAVRRRMNELRDAVTRVAFAEYEAADDEDVRDWALEELGVMLFEQSGDPDFARQPLDAHVAQVCEELGLSASLAARWHELPEPPCEADADLEPGWRGSG